MGGDGPAFEAWPRKTEWYLHEYLLALWGIIIGEMFDLEVSTQGKVMKARSELGNNRLYLERVSKDRGGHSFSQARLSTHRVRSSALCCAVRAALLTLHQVALQVWLTPWPYSDLLNFRCDDPHRKIQEHS